MMIIPPSSIFRLLKSSIKLWTKGITMELNRCTSHLVQGTYNFWKDAYLNFSLSYLAKKKKKNFSLSCFLHWPFCWCFELFQVYVSWEILRGPGCSPVRCLHTIGKWTGYHPSFGFPCNLRYIMSFFYPML